MRNRIYSAGTYYKDGEAFEHTGTVAEARELAIEYAKSAFPAWVYEGLGPKITVDDADTGDRLLEERL